MTALSEEEQTFARELLDLWSKAHEDLPLMTTEDFTRWSGATKDLLLGLGLEWDPEIDNYRFSWESPRHCGQFQKGTPGGDCMGDGHYLCGACKERAR